MEKLEGMNVLGILGSHTVPLKVDLGPDFLEKYAGVLRTKSQHILLFFDKQGHISSREVFNQICRGQSIDLR